MMKLLLLAAGLIFVSTASAQKVGMLDQQRVLQAFKDAQVVERELQALVKSWEDTALRYQQFIADRAEKFKKNIESLSASQRFAELDTLVGMRRLLDSYNMSKSTTGEGEFWQERNRRYAPVLDKYYKAVAAVAKREKIDLVLNMNTVTLIANAPNITDAVIKELEK
jgi:outer membrane protein